MNDANSFLTRIFYLMITVQLTCTINEAAEKNGRILLTFQKLVQ